MSEVLAARAVGKRFGTRVALEGVSFSAAAGEVVAVLGPNGAGKTTLLSILASVQQASSGSVEVRGGLGWVPQQPALYGKLTVFENLDLFARLERIADPPAAVAAMIEQIELRERAGEQVARLSGGNRQRVNIAIGLIADPAVLLLDEPAAALDPRQRDRLWDFLRIRAAGGTAILYSTHDVAEAERHAARLLVLADGELLFDGSPGQLLQLGGPEGGLERAFLRFLQSRGH